MPLLVVGSIGIDTILTETGKAENVLGGSASYAAVSAAFFGRVNLVGIVGDDFPEEHLRLFRSRRVNLEGLETVRGGRTFRWTGRYHPDFVKRDTVEIHLNVFESFRPAIPPACRAAPFVLLSNIDPELQLSVLDQTERPGFVAADTMNLWLDIKRPQVEELLSRVDLIVMNDEEAQQYAGEKNLISAGRKLLRPGAKWAVIKKGAHGALLFSRSGVVPMPAFPVERVVDPTGAGDCFIGGLMGYLSRAGKTGPGALKRAVAFGTVMASFDVEAYSLDRLKNLDKKQVMGRYARFRTMLAF